MNKKIRSMLSLAMKAGKIKTGAQACEISLSDGTASLVIICSDASDNTKEKFINKANYYKKPYVIYGTIDDVSASIGRDNRSVITVTEQGFGDTIKKLMIDDEQ